jgi:two-component system chemotaxis sensor kinase CheA
VTEVIREFLLETHENVGQLDADLLILEKDPRDAGTIARVFRTLHTIKGTAGFLGLSKLQTVTHAGENLLSRIRAGERLLTPETATALLGVVDAVRTILSALEETQGKAEGTGEYADLIRTLEQLTTGEAKQPAAPPSGSTTAKPQPAVPPVAEPPPARQPEVPLPAVHLAPTLLPGSDTPTNPIPPAPRVPPVPPVPSGLSPPPAVSVPPAPSLLTTAGARSPAPEPADSRAQAVADTSVRVDVGLLDKLMNLVGELVLARNQIVQFGNTQEDRAFLGAVARLNLLTAELQAGVIKTRMQPVGNVWGKFPRLVRDLAVACGKQVRLDMDGQDTELDRTIIEAVRDPLMHMVRNAVDHGIEAPAERVARGKPIEGRLTLHAVHESGKVVIELSDDGCGIDPQKVRERATRAGLVSAEQAARMSERELIDLIFLPGFTTTDRVTQFSGRGVGMDVVRTNIEKIGGTVDMETAVGRGTRVRMKIPLTLAIVPALTVISGGDRYAIPQVSLLELIRVEGDRAGRGVESVHGATVYRRRGELLPLVFLDRELRVESTRPAGADLNIVVLQADERTFGLVVDEIRDTEEIVVKPLQKQLKGLAPFSGATIMGDGKVALILDVLGLAQRAGVMSGDRARPGEESAPTAAVADRHTVLLCAVRGGRRLAIPLEQVARLEELPRSAVERVGRGAVVQYRGDILPLVYVGRAIEGADPPARERRGRPRRRTPRVRNNGSIKVVVHTGPQGSIGLVVGRIIDIVEEAVTTRARGGPGILFTAVVQGRVTEFLDVEQLVQVGERENRRPET